MLNLFELGVFPIGSWERPCKYQQEGLGNGP